MRKVIISLFLMLFTITVFGQDYKLENNTFSKVEKSVNKDTTKVETGYFYEVNGTKYPIYIGKTGACYILRISKITGSEYRQYLGEELSKQLTTLLNKEYKPKK